MRASVAGVMVGLILGGCLSLSGQGSKSPGQASTAGCPGGLNTQFQYNDNGACKGGSVVFDKLTNVAAITGRAVLDGPTTNVSAWPDTLRLASNYLYDNNVHVAAADVTPMRLLQTWFTNTVDLAPATPLQPLVLSAIFGSGGAPAIGSPIGFGNHLIIEGSGNLTNEMVNFGASMRMDVGTGYNHGTTTGMLTFTDFGMEGPIGLQTRSWDGIRIIGNNHFDGSPILGESGLFWAMTQQGNNPMEDAIHAAAPTYPLDVGFGVIGTTTNGQNGMAFKTAFRAGGGGSGSGLTSSRIGTGFKATDYLDRGIFVDAAAAAGAPAIETTLSAGPVILGDLATTGAAAGKTLVCADVTGRLYRSSSATTCAN